MALVVAIATRTQAAAAAHNSRDDQFCFAVFPTEIMTLPFRESDLFCTVLARWARPRSLPGGGAHYSSTAGCREPSKLE
jgi:hypothetical protein